jgi:hypothetical protein
VAHPFRVLHPVRHPVGIVAKVGDYETLGDHVKLICRLDNLSCAIVTATGETSEP